MNSILINAKITILALKELQTQLLGTHYLISGGSMALKFSRVDHHLMEK